MEAVSSGEMTVTASSRVFKVPRKTLDDRIKGNVAHGTKPGRTTNIVPLTISFTWLSFDKNHGKSLRLGNCKAYRQR